MVKQLILNIQSYVEFICIDSGTHSGKLDLLIKLTFWSRVLGPGLTSRICEITEILPRIYITFTTVEKE